MKTETSAYATERAKRQTRPVYFVRFYHVPTSASGTDYPFSVDFSSGPVPGSTKTKYPWMMAPEGNTQTVEAELGQSTIGNFKIGLVDVGDEVTKYMANGFPNSSLTLNGALSAGATTVPTNENTVNYPAVGTIEILTAGVIERIRYTGKTTNSFTGCTRGVDGTSGVTHNNADPIGNGEQIRPGQRMQLFAGYQDLPGESDFLSFCKMQVGQRDELDPKTWVIECDDILRTLRQTVFLNASGSTAGTGTLATTAASAAVVGTGTAFTTQLAPGMVILLPTGETIAVLSVTDATHFTATQPCAATASGQTFQINPPTVLAGNPIDCALAVLISSGAFVALTGTVTKTAGSAAIVGSGTLFTSELGAGSVVRTADGEILRVSTITDNTHFTAVQNAILTAAQALTARKGPPATPWDLLDAVNGLALPAALVDVATFTTLRGSDFPSDQYEFSIIAPTDGKTWLETEIFKTMNCYPVVNQTGQLSIKRYKLAVGSPSVTLDPDVIINATLSQADRQIINVLQFAYDWNVAGAAGVFGVRQIYEKMSGSLNNPLSIEKYGRRTALIIESQGLRSALGAGAIADSRALEGIRRYAEPQAIVQADCLYSKHTLEPGD